MKSMRLAMMVFASAFTLSLAAQTMSSANYSVPWAVKDGAGNLLLSSNYSLNDTIAQPSPPGVSTGAIYALEGGFFATPDTDTDQVRDFMDNCTLDINATQYDSNSDGYGNICDPDIDNSGIVNFADYALLVTAFLSTPGSPNWNADADFTGDDVVNFIDISLFQFFFLQAPGPSGTAP